LGKAVSHPKTLVRSLSKPSGKGLERVHIQFRYR
jgi:hypothetical protein